MKNSWQIGAFLLVAAAAVPASFAQPAPPPAPPPPPRARAAGIAVQTAPYLGVSVMDVDAARAKALKLNQERGAEITQTDPAGPAAKAGVKVGDVVLEFNGQQVEGSQHLQRLVREMVPGQSAKLSVWRNGAAQPIAAMIESRRMAMIGGEPFAVEAPQATPEPPIPAMSSHWPDLGWPPDFEFDIPRIQTVMQNAALGIAGEPLGDERQFAEFFGVKDGVLVKSVDSNSPAQRAGIKAGDVIVKVGETRVGSLRELTTALRTVRSKGAYAVTVVRNKKEMPLTVVSN